MIAILETTREIHRTRGYRQFKGAPRPETPTHGHEAAQELLGWEAQVYEMPATRWSAYGHETPSGQAARASELHSQSVVVEEDLYYYRRLM
jgi:hypothetical protein